MAELSFRLLDLVLGAILLLLLMHMLLFVLFFLFLFMIVILMFVVIVVVENESQRGVAPRLGGRLAYGRYANWSWEEPAKVNRAWGRLLVTTGRTYLDGKVATVEIDGQSGEAISGPTRREPPKDLGESPERDLLL